MPDYVLPEEDSGLELQRLRHDREAISEANDDLDDDMSVESLETLSFGPGEERRLVRKLDRRVVGLVALLYLLSFLDRSNIGNAKIAGLMADLKLTDAQFEWLLTAFYLTYIAFEWMALLFKLIPPHIYLAVVVCSWGVIASLQSVTASFGQMIFLRTLLGLGEAAFCGVPFYLSFFYRRNELAFRTGLFISAAPLATAFASSIAWAITALARLTPVAPWRMLFLVEGFPSIIVAWYCWHNVVDSPGEALFLTDRERSFAVQRLVEGSSKAKSLAKKHDEKRSVDISQVSKTLTDPKSYIVAAMYFCTNVAFSSMPVFLPTIIQEMGHTNVVAQALSAPPYLVAFFVVLAAAWLSDRKGARARFVIMFALLAAAGYSIVVVAGLLGLPNFVRYMALYLACAGFFTCITIILTWTLNNQESESGKGTGIALLQFLGQCGPLLGIRLFPATDSPLYIKGMSVCAASMIMVAILAFILARLLRAENERRQRRSNALNMDDNGGMDNKFLYII